MFLAKFEDQMIKEDTIVQTLKDINTYCSEGNRGKTFLQALEKDFPLISWIGDIWNKGWRRRSGHPPNGTMQEGHARRRRCCQAAGLPSRKEKILPCGEGTVQKGEGAPPGI